MCCQERFEQTTVDRSEHSEGTFLPEQVHALIFNIDRYRVQFFGHLFLGPICTFLDALAPFVTFMLIALKIDGDITCTWREVFIPMLVQSICWLLSGLSAFAYFG